MAARKRPEDHTFKSEDSSGGVKDIIDTTGGNQRLPEEEFIQRYKKAMNIMTMQHFTPGLMYTKMLDLEVKMALADSEGPPLEDIIPPAKLQRDLQIGLPLLHISFLLNHLIPRRYISWIMFKWNAKRLQDSENQVSANTSLLKPELAGSIPEGFAVPPHFRRQDFVEGLLVPKGGFMETDLSDADMVVVGVDRKVGFTSQDKEVMFTMETSHTYPGYCRLVCLTQTNESNNKYRVQNPGTDKYYISSGKVMRDKTVKKEQLKNLQMKFLVVNHGPATTVEPARKFENFTLDVDNVLALPVIAWPKEAAKWLDRKPAYDWPSQELKKKLVSDGCLVVPVAHHTSSWCEVEWRISFSRAERALAETLDDIHRQSYIVLKVLVKHVLNPIKAITSYHLKTLLLWTCEKLPKDAFHGKEEGLASCVLLLLDNLLHAIIKHNLPHFFFTQNNLFSHIHSDFMVEIGKRVSWLRSNLPQAIFNFDNEYFFSFTPRTDNLESLMRPLVDNSWNLNNDVTKAYEAQASVLHSLATSLLQDAKFDDMIDTCREACLIRRKILGEDVDFITLINDIAVKGPPVYLLQTYESLMLRFQNTRRDRLYWLKGKTATLYHNMVHKKYYSPSETNMMMERAEMLFAEAITDENVTGDTWVEYATYCLKEGYTDEATTAATNAKESGAGLKNAFSKKDVFTMPECLARDIKRDGDLCLDTTIYASFLLFLCKTQQKLRDEAEANLQNLEQLICSSNPEDSALFRILGYGWTALEKYSKAKEMFAKALALNPGSNTAREGIAECDTYAKQAGIVCKW